MGFRYLAASIPIICLTGVAIGVGLIWYWECMNPNNTIGLLIRQIIIYNKIQLK